MVAMMILKTYFRWGSVRVQLRIGCSKRHNKILDDDDESKDNSGRHVFDGGVSKSRKVAPKDISFRAAAMRKTVRSKTAMRVTAEIHIEMSGQRR